MRTAAAIIMVLLAPLQAGAHPHTPTILGGPLTSRPVQEWDLAVRLEGSLTPDLVVQYNNVVREKPKPQVARAPRVFRGMGTDVEQWRPLVQTYFLPVDVEWAMRVIACESGGNPQAKNPRSTASGLFQHLASYWPARSSAAGWAGSSIFDPEPNVAVAAWLVYFGGGRGHWNASKHCWG